MPPSARRSNRLGREKSPYLLQHARNPVDWYPWGDEAFARAHREDKPVFLSIGYSTCHWCHVMERESFDDEETAGRLNEAFVCVKVDREERPDLDQYYMAVCQALTGSGGWPLTVVLTPDRKPFFAGTYFPKTRRWGRPGLTELIPSIRQYWLERREEVLRSADEIASAVIGREIREGEKEAATAESASPPSGIGTSTRIDDDKESAGPIPAILREAFVELETDFDPGNGGFGGAPKFPTPHNLTFLLRYWKGTGRAEALAMVEATLRGMRRGGIYDQLGSGFHRYSTDAAWLVPHFEKMIYDQALLVRAFVDAFLATGKDEYRQTAFETLEYALRDMTSPEGGFYSAEDADSEGQEGGFYLWTAAEVREVLGGAEASSALDAFSVRPEGNFTEPGHGGPDGRNILHRPRRGVEGGSGAALEAVRDRLFRARERRVHPFKDTKVLADWNGLMIGALAAAGRTADDDRFIRAAEKAVRFVLKKMRIRPGGLFHAYSDGEARIPAFLDDHAFLADGLIELYEATFDPGHLEEALALTDRAISLFWDTERGGFHFVRPGTELPYRAKEIYDGALPSGNSMMLMNLLRLARMTGRPDLEEKAAKMSAAFAGDLRAHPRAHTAFLCALDFAAGPSNEVVIVGRTGDESTAALLRALAGAYLPNTVVLFKPVGKAASGIAGEAKRAGKLERPAESEGSPEIGPKPGGAITDPTGTAARVEALAPFLREMKPAPAGRAAAYVCKEGLCLEPVTSADELIRVLSGART